MTVLTTNLAALTARRYQADAQNGVASAIERLSSGWRINSARDDAAGLAIANRLQVNRNADQQISRGINDGISLVQTAEGGLNGINDLLQRSRQLAVQAANGTLSDSDRASINQEFQQLRDEIDRIATDTTIFGKTPLAPATPQPQAVKLGNTANVSDVIDNSGSSYQSGINAVAYIPAGTKNFTLTIDSGEYDDDIQIFTQDGKHLIGTPLTGAYPDNVWLYQGVSDEASANAKVVTPTAGFLPDASYDASQFVDATGQYSAATPSVVQNYGGMQILYSGDGDRQAVDQADVPDSTFNDGRINPPEEADSRTESVTIDNASEALLLFVVGEGSYTARASWDELPLVYQAPPPPTGPISTDTDIVVSADYGQPISKITIPATPADSATLGLDNTALDPADRAVAALGDLDRAMARVDSYRGQYGALSNRLEGAITAVNAKQTITATAQSRIMDADYALETANLTRERIFSQASNAMLAQANQTPQAILTLLE